MLLILGVSPEGAAVSLGKPLTASPLLSVRDLRVRFCQGESEVTAVAGVSFDIHRGECFALVGESGSGKSVSALSVMRLLQRQGTRLEGDVLLDGVDLFSLPEQAMETFRGGRIGMVFQDPMTSLNPVLSIGYQLGEVITRHQGLQGEPQRLEAMAWLDQVGLPDPREQLKAFPHQLSGGMRQRVMIAMALAGLPDLLIADEPTTALDVTLQAQILELLLRLQRERGMALWLITHDFGTVFDLADRIAVMHQGVLVETAGRTFFDGPIHPYSQALLKAMPRLDACFERAFSGSIASKENREALLSVRDVTVRYEAQRGLFSRQKPRPPAVDGVSFEMEPGETLALVGASGCGKTSLGKALLGLVPMVSGEVLLAGYPLSGEGGRTRCEDRGMLQMVFQDPFASMNPRMVVADILEEGLWALRPSMDPSERSDRVQSLLTAVGLEASALGRYPHEFSGGQRQRLCIARALAVEPKILICDEPTSALDVSVQAQVIDLLKSLQQRFGHSYLFITHDLGVVSALADRVAVMHDGRLVEMGPVREVLFHPQSPHTRRLLDALPVLRRGRLSS